MFKQTQSHELPSDIALPPIEHEPRIVGHADLEQFGISFFRGDVHIEMWGDPCVVVYDPKAKLAIVALGDTVLAKCASDMTSLRALRDHLEDSYSPGERTQLQVHIASESHVFEYFTRKQVNDAARGMQAVRDVLRSVGINDSQITEHQKPEPNPGQVFVFKLKENAVELD